MFNVLTSSTHTDRQTDRQTNSIASHYIRSVADEINGTLHDYDGVRSMSHVQAGYVTAMSQPITCSRMTLAAVKAQYAVFIVQLSLKSRHTQAQQHVYTAHSPPAAQSTEQSTEITV